MSLGVDPKLQSRGVGRALVGAFEEELRHRGCAAYWLTTDESANDAANNFYTRLGFLRSRVVVTPEGRHLNEYTKSLSADGERP